MNVRPQAGPAIALDPTSRHRRDDPAIGARVLDIGCGDGALLEYLLRVKGVDGRGARAHPARTSTHCVARGLSVVQGDADTDLTEYPSGVFDVVILSQTIQATRRSARRARGAAAHRQAHDRLFPNFGHLARALVAADRRDACR